MRAIALFAAAVGIAGSMSAQEIRNVRIDFGYGTAPALHNPTGSGLRGIHANVAAETPWGGFGLLYLSRNAPVQPYYGNEQNTSTIALQIEQSWRTSRAQFTISGGLGIFSVKITGYTYYWQATTVNTQTFTRVAIPAGMRICWYFNDHFGVGAAFLGAYVPDYSYIGMHLFVRVGL